MPVIRLLHREFLGEGLDPEEVYEVVDQLDSVIIGDPDACVAKMKRYADLGVDQMVCRVEYGHLSHESIMKNIELLGKEVLPELEKYVPPK